MFYCIKLKFDEIKAPQPLTYDFIRKKRKKSDIWKVEKGDPEDLV